MIYEKRRPGFPVRAYLPDMATQVAESARVAGCAPPQFKNMLWILAAPAVRAASTVGVDAALRGAHAELLKLHSRRT
jgi:hypothetical protein